MKVMVIGGTGHIGRFLVPMLVEAGHQVAVVARGRTPQPPGAAWESVKILPADTAQLADWTPLVAERPEVVVDIPGTARRAYEAFRGVAAHLIAIGSLWMYGEPRVVPTPEETQGPCPFEGYAQRYADIQDMAARGDSEGMAFTAIMPPNICGPGKIPLECLGGRDLAVHQAHAAGEEVVLPDGPEALVGPCDAEDVAYGVFLAMTHRQEAAGQIFNVGSVPALTWTEFVAAYEEIYGISIPIRRVSWQEYTERISPSMGHWWHLKAPMCPDIRKAQLLLEYEPRYSPWETLARAVDWMRQEGLIHTANSR